jgi:hypothetical protein
MKGVLLWSLTGVCVDKKIVQIFVYLVIDIYDFFTRGLRKTMEKYKFKPQGANILGVIN